MSKAREPWERGTRRARATVHSTLASPTLALRPMPKPDITAVTAYLRGLHDRITAALETADGRGRFRRDSWQRAEGGGGESRVLQEGGVFEQAGINFSHVRG